MKYNINEMFKSDDVFDLFMSTIVIILMIFSLTTLFYLLFCFIFYITKHEIIACTSTTIAIAISFVFVVEKYAKYIN